LIHGFEKYWLPRDLFEQPEPAGDLRSLDSCRNHLGTVNFPPPPVFRHKNCTGWHINR
jgi:hypothetical protein